MYGLTSHAALLVTKLCAKYYRDEFFSPSLVSTRVIRIQSGLLHFYMQKIFHLYTKTGSSIIYQIQISTN